MNSTFSRALTGFVILTVAIVLLALVALWALGAFTDGNNWASLIIVVVAMVAEIGVYSSTLHEPIYRWIKEPQEEKERAERAAQARDRAGKTPSQAG